MAISFSCAECDHAFKVKDDLAGRKIKCPECGESNSVPAGKAKAAGAVAAGKAKAKHSDTDDYEEVEERAQKKRKKKNRNKSNTGRILLAGGALLFVAAVVVLVIVIVNRKEDEPKERKVASPQPTPEVPSKKVEPPTKDYSTGIAGVMERTELLQRVDQIAKAYVACDLESSGKGAANRDVLSAAFQKNYQLLEVLEKRWVTFIYGVGTKQMGADAARTMIAYQTDKDGAGMRVVIMGNGQIQTIDDTTFRNTKKAK
jgi:hypothetical protein